MLFVPDDNAINTIYCSCVEVRTGSQLRRIRSLWINYLAHWETYGSTVLTMKCWTHMSNKFVGIIFREVYLCVCIQYVCMYIYTHTHIHT
jgi:hypothetical protein